MAANISLEELQKVLERSGLPMGDSFAMQQAKPGIRQAIAPNVGGGGDPTRKRILTQLDQIAKMDQKLGGVYGDPTSKLFIEDPMARESAVYGHRNTDFNEVSRLGNQAEGEDQLQEQNITEAEQAYQELTAAQKQLEAEQKRLAKGTGKGKTKGIVSALAGVKLTKEQKMAGFQDPDAANFFSKIKEADFKRLWVQNQLEGGGVPEGGFDIDTVKENYSSWKKQQEKIKAQEKAKKEAQKKTSKKTSSSSSKKLF